MDSEDLDVNIISTPGPSKSATPVPSNSREEGLSESVVVPQNLIVPQTLKAVGQFMECGDCTKKFTVVSTSIPAVRLLSLIVSQTAYTKEHPRQPSSWICVNCCYSLGIDPFAKAKKPAKPKIAAKREDRAKIVHYEQRKGVSALSDSCIQVGFCEYALHVIYDDPVDRQVHRGR